MKKAIVIIPTYNEEGVISETVENLINDCRVVKDIDISVLIVDSNSQDNTINEVKSLQKKYQQVFCIEEDQKLGLGNAYMYAMEHAVNKLYADIVFEFDADGSHGSYYIPKMLDQIEKGADVVVGSRYVSGAVFLLIGEFIVNFYR